ncbi:D-methionine transport system ATP-binding protein [Peptoniphilus asaccharolyticus DSM 20463]|uniref:D-methionine transport system ATP-binding protein n=1 Tax=Peptoniphilus asaccharolyticus DSM 20463 TaxID=573058 RepID=A0A1W1VFL4_PEPAS|nr:ATP-binding cassette domain-containing protein [Peptoniphilus asaccharolyticus]MBL7575880.1 ATP-binding cassette domain-containing protein [Peptoniphilus asaccharolyticus]SMB92096.1 D-methionine transport system ATP-binding protein [Peptoniphilus asaccharolyticus DSM 20463]
MIEVKNLIKEFKLDGAEFKAVDNVSFSVERGQIYGIIGLSGAGKSTLVRCLNRLEEPTSGEIIVDGKNILDLSEKELLEERRQIGMIFQNFNLFMQKTVYQNIAYPLEISNVSKDKIDERVNELLKFIDLEEKKNAYPSELSGGQKQRVAIARSIATNPKILLSDEGTSALDPANTKVILELLKKVVATYKMTIVMITHQMEVAQDICDRIAVMDHGKIVEENETEQLFKNPKTALTRSFIQHLDVAEEIVASEFKGTILRLVYDGENLAEPILSKCLKEYNVYFNIISANVNKLTEGAMGYLTIEITGEDQEVDKAIKYLKNSKVSVEVL